MLGNPKAPDIMEQLRRLGQMRIQVHAQVVLCSGVNDGDRLARTIEDLASLYPTVQSVAVVPVGITRHTIERKGSTISRPSAAEARELIEQVTSYQRKFRKEIECGFVYAADELYLTAGIPVPPATHYDDYPQLGNGIGVTRKFLEEWRYVKRKLSRLATALCPDIQGPCPSRTFFFHAEPQRSPRLGEAPRRPRPFAAALGDNEKTLPNLRRRVAVVTGTLFAPTFQAIIDELNRLGVAAFDLVPVTNSFFGPTVPVAGLLTGSDILATLRRQSFSDEDLVILPRKMLDVDGKPFLDGLTSDNIPLELWSPVVPANSLREIVSLDSR